MLTFLSAVPTTTLSPLQSMAYTRSLTGRVMAAAPVLTRGSQIRTEVFVCQCVFNVHSLLDVLFCSLKYFLIYSFILPVLSHDPVTTTPISGMKQRFRIGWSCLPRTVAVVVG